MTLGICSVASAANWVNLGANSDMQLYIDDSRMDAFENKYGHLIIEYWITTALTDEGKAKILQFAQDAGTYQSWMDDMSYMVIHIKTNCNTKQENQILVSAYSSDNQLLSQGPGYVRNIEEGTNSQWWNAKVAQYFMMKLEQKKQSNIQNI
jgi:hypothetical protein